MVSPLNAVVVVVVVSKVVCAVVAGVASRRWSTEEARCRAVGGAMSPVVWLRCRCRWWFIVGVSVQLTHRGAASPRSASRRRWTRFFPEISVPAFSEKSSPTLYFPFGSTNGLRLAWLRGLRIFFFEHGTPVRDITQHGVYYTKQVSPCIGRSRLGLCQPSPEALRAVWPNSFLRVKN